MGEILFPTFDNKLINGNTIEAFLTLQNRTKPYILFENKKTNKPYILAALQMRTNRNICLDLLDDLFIYLFIT